MEIARIQRETWFFCTLIAVVGGVIIAYLGLKAVIVLAGTIAAVATVSRKRIGAIAKSSAMSGAQTIAAWAPAVAALLLMAAAAAATRRFLSREQTALDSKGVLLVPTHAMTGATENLETVPDGSVETVSEMPPIPTESPATNRTGEHRQARPSSVRMNATQVTGAMPPDVIQRIVNGEQRLQPCYQKNAERLLTASGDFVVTFTIGRSGEVSDVRIKEASTKDYTIIGCVAQVLSSLSFPQPEGGIVEVTYNIRIPKPAAHVPALSVERDRRGVIKIGTGSEGAPSPPRDAGGNKFELILGSQKSEDGGAHDP